MLAYVLNKHGKPLMPCSPGKARRLLKEGKAKVVSREPFTIKLLYGSSGYKQEVKLGVDAGAAHIGAAARAKSGQVLYASEIDTRRDISEKLTQRRSYRRTRRGRKLRHREPRFDNRVRKDGWLTPTVRSKTQAHVAEINSIKSILFPLLRTGQLYNLAKYENPSVDNLIGLARQMSDVTSRNLVYKSLFEVISKECPVHFLGSEEGRYIISTDWKLPGLSGLGFYNLKLKNARYQGGDHR